MSERRYKHLSLYQLTKLFDEANQATLEMAKNVSKFSASEIKAIIKRNASIAQEFELRKYEGGKL